MIIFNIGISVLYIARFCKRTDSRFNNAQGTHCVQASPRRFSPFRPQRATKREEFKVSMFFFALLQLARSNARRSASHYAVFPRHVGPYLITHIITARPSFETHREAHCVGREFKYFNYFLSTRVTSIFVRRIFKETLSKTCHTRKISKVVSFSFLFFAKYLTVCGNDTVDSYSVSPRCVRTHASL